MKAHTVELPTNDVIVLSKGHTDYYDFAFCLHFVGGESVFMTSLHHSLTVHTQNSRDRSKE